MSGSAKASDGLLIRVLKSEELELLPRFWVQDVGIPMELRFIKRWYMSDPDGFRIAIDSKGKLVAMASVLKQTNNVFVMGYMGVAKDYRGKGVGRRLLDNLLARSPLANYVISASEEKLEMYLKRGFRRVDDCSGFSYIGKFNFGKQTTNLPSSLELIKVKQGHPILAEVMDYDATICGFRRNVELLQFGEPSSVVLAMKRQGKIVAYGKIQKYMLGGAWLGPVYADDVTVASYLIDSLMRNFEHERCPFVFVIFSARAQPIAKALNLKLADRLTRCYLTVAPDSLPTVKMSNVYAFDDVGFSLV